MKFFGFVYNCVNLLDILCFRESKFDQAQSRKSQQSSCSKSRECFRSCPVNLRKFNQSLCHSPPSHPSAPHGLDLPELPLPLLGLPEGAGPPLLEALHAGRGPVAAGGEQRLVTRLAHQAAVRALEVAPLIKLVTRREFLRNICCHREKEKLERYASSVNICL